MKTTYIYRNARKPTKFKFCIQSRSCCVIWLAGYKLCSMHCSNFHNKNVNVPKSNVFVHLLTCVFLLKLKDSGNVV